ncbi:hypothetical protein X737_26700 [Mesorhizobium sp. L48C026A00]|nr:hypothetical protein X737_26700 [Mesorhizobium sp. L48C026A00]
MQQVIAARAGVEQPFGRRVAADEEGRDRGAQFTAQVLDGLDACLPIVQSIIRNDEVRLLSLQYQFRKRLFPRLGGDDLAAPASEDSAHALEHERIVIDHDDEFASC